MMIQTNQIDKHFPELLGITLRQKEEIVEMARYQVYMKKGGRKKFVRPYIFYGFLGWIAVIVLSTIISPFIPVESTTITIVGTMSVFAIAFHQMQKHWIKQMHPKVLELVERYHADA